MIITSAPLRLSFNGGGSDLPAFFTRNPGHVVSMPLNKRVYVTLNKSFSGNYRIAYSKIEVCNQIQDIQHPLVRACLTKIDWVGPGLEITSIADVPSSGTGLGSSSAFTVALLNGLLSLQGRRYRSIDLAKLACEIEVDVLGSPIGFQDQYVSSFGGLNYYEFSGDGTVKISRVFDSQKKEAEFVKVLRKHMCFFHVNLPRDANTILERQNKTITSNQKAFLLTKKLAELSKSTVACIKQGNISELGQLMLEGWKIKCSLNGDDNNPSIRKLLEWGHSSDILGAKLMGAGGGGFLAVIASPEKHRIIRKQLDYLQEFDAVVDIQGPRLGEF